MVRGWNSASSGSIFCRNWPTLSIVSIVKLLSVLWTMVFLKNLVGYLVGTHFIVKRKTPMSESCSVEHCCASTTSFPYLDHHQFIIINFIPKPQAKPIHISHVHNHLFITINSIRKLQSVLNFRQPERRRFPGNADAVYPKFEGRGVFKYSRYSRDCYCYCGYCHTTFVHGRLRRFQVSSMNWRQFL